MLIPLFLYYKKTTKMKLYIKILQPTSRDEALLHDATYISNDPSFSNTS